MSITEFILPLFTKDTALLQQVKTVLPAAAQAAFAGVPGLLNRYTGGIVKAQNLSDGTDITHSNVVIVLEWDQLESFKTFIASDRLVNFKLAVKPFLVAPPTPELFSSEAMALSGGTTQSKYTQYIKVTPSSGARGPEADIKVESVWAALVASLGSKEASSFAAWATYETTGFAGLIGWDSIEAFESATQTPEAQKSFQELATHGTVLSYLLQLEKK